VAAERALLTGGCRYKSVESILKNSLDQTPASSPPRFIMAGLAFLGFMWRQSDVKREYSTLWLPRYAFRSG
jgi:hypothetical protein